MSKRKAPWPCLGCGTLLSGRGGKRYCGPDCRPRCDIDDCGRPTHSKGMCSAHSRRASRHGDPLTPLVRKPNEGACSVDDCDQPMRKTGLCAGHYVMLARYGEIREWNYRWGEGGYVPTHALLRRTRGRPETHACVDCGLTAREWSYDGGDPAEQIDPNRGCPFTRNFEYYSPRCVRCHRFYDENPIAMR